MQENCSEGNNVKMYIQKEEWLQINNPAFHLKKLEKEEKIKPKANRVKEIIKIKSEINKIQNKKSIEGLPWWCSG